METMRDAAYPPDPGTTPQRSRANSIWIGAVFLAASVALATLGGGALVGVLLLLTGSFPYPGQSPSQINTFIFVLYVVTAGCFLGAAVLLVLGCRSLLR